MMVDSCLGIISEDVSTASKPLSPSFLARIAKAYRYGLKHFESPNSELWNSIVERSREVHEALMSDNFAALGTLLGNPGAHYLFYGFDNLCKDDVELLRARPDIRAARGAQVAYLLRELATTLGVQRIPNPDFAAHGVTDSCTTAAQVVDRIERLLGVTLEFPNCFPDEHGLVSVRGIISHRSVFGLYQAARVKALARHFGNSVLEIGAGQGRGAHHAYRMGVRDYTIVDLPLTNVSQATFLGLALGEENVVLNGEPERKGAVRIVTPDYLERQRRKYNVVVNSDSLTEINETEANRYAKFISENANVFYSVNHEANPYTVRQLAALQGCCISRGIYTLRVGYAEELFVFPRRGWF